MPKLCPAQAQKCLVESERASERNRARRLTAALASEPYCCVVLCDSFYRNARKRRPMLAHFLERVTREFVAANLPVQELLPLASCRAHLRR